MKDPQILGGVVVALVIIVAFLVYDRHYNPPTLGEKLGQSIDRAANKMEDAVDGKR
ncbi:MAG: hypothetical protein ACAH80_03060 [Alphaproteobacteria bacterium]